MHKPVWFYGLLSGSIIIGINTLNVELGNSQVWLGFLVMFIALSIIFIAIKQQRDHHNGGVITFAAAFKTGVAIASIATCVYVLVWEIYLNKTDFKFIQLYIDSVILMQETKGVSEAEITDIKSQMADFSERYRNPLIRLPMTAMEIFPVGLLISFISAALLKNHNNVRKTNK